jgi:hypothetical protein
VATLNQGDCLTSLVAIGWRQGDSSATMYRIRTTASTYDVTGLHMANPIPETHTYDVTSKLHPATLERACPPIKFRMTYHCDRT